jgi:hypothetical protein
MFIVNQLMGQKYCWNMNTDDAISTLLATWMSSDIGHLVTVG